MPGVVSLHESSETQSKPDYFRGQCWGAIGLLIGSLSACFCCPLQLEIQQGGAHLGGVHFELTGDNVTECLGGACGVTEADLARDYRTQVDPRLNYEQSLEMALLLARLMAQQRK
jgi:hypothetical protein